MKRRSASLQPTLQQLLDPGDALAFMPAPLQSTPGSGLTLPNFSALSTRQDTISIPAPRPRDLPLQPTLDDTVIDGLIEALYSVLPEALSQPLAETTTSGNRIGRHGFAPGIRPDSIWTPASVPAADSLTDETTDLPLEEPTTPPPPPLEPRPYVVGAVPEGLPLITLRSLSQLELALPAENAVGRLTKQAVLGQGEACFLRAQSALWTWRTHRQVNMEAHAEGPPSLGRHVLIEQRIGPVTLLLGCRITEMIEEERRWGFTLGSLSGQVLQSSEHFLVEWQADDQVVFSVDTQQQLAMPNLTFLAPVYSALRRKFKQGYIRNMLELTAN